MHTSLMDREKPSPKGIGIYTTFHRNKNNKLQKYHTPSPVGEGRGEESKINCLHSPHPGEASK
jgi:hypothetical protein